MADDLAFSEHCLMSPITLLCL